jgi:hypothetical protein
VGGLSIHGGFDARATEPVLAIPKRRAMPRYALWAFIVLYSVLSLALVVGGNGVRVTRVEPRAPASLAPTAARAADATPVPTETPSAMPSAMPSATPSPVAAARVVLIPALGRELPPIALESAAVSAPNVTVAPAAVPTASSVPVRAPDAPPQIFEVQIPSEAVHPGETVSGNVLTSSNVAAVEVRLARYSMSLLKVGEGRFTLTMTVPHIPFFLRWRTYMIDIVAHNVRGDVVEQTLPITVR